MDRFQQAYDIFEGQGGMLRTSEALAHGIDAPTLYELRDRGTITQVARGLYRLADLPPLAHPDLVAVAARVPAAVICLISALHYHGLTREIPRAVYVALPQHIRQPRLAHPPLEVVWLSPEPYEAGIQTVTLDGVDVQMYDPEKTVADSFKFRNKYGLDVALDALKAYVGQPAAARDLPALLRYARIDRVERVMEPYLEALL